MQSIVVPGVSTGIGWGIMKVLVQHSGCRTAFEAVWGSENDATPYEIDLLTNRQTSI